MKKLLLSFLALIILGTAYAPASMAQTQDFDIRPFAKRLLTQDIDKAFTGITLDGAYNFSRSAQASNTYVETHNENNTVKYTEDGLETAGYWLTMDDVICYKYPRSRFQGGCFRVYQVENCYYFYSIRLPEDPDEIQGDFWTARGVKQGEASRCEAVFS